MSQLRRGAKEVLTELYDRIRQGERRAKTLHDSEMRDILYDLFCMIKEDIEPLLQRASPAEPSAEQRQRATEERVKALEARMAAIEPILSLIEQRNAQRY